MTWFVLKRSSLHIFYGPFLPLKTRPIYFKMQIRLSTLELVKGSMSSLIIHQTYVSYSQSKHFHLLRGKCVSLHKACHVMDSSDLIGSFNNARVAYWSI